MYNIKPDLRPDWNLTLQNSRNFTSRKYRIRIRPSIKKNMHGYHQKPNSDPKLVKLWIRIIPNYPDPNAQLCWQLWQSQARISFLVVRSILVPFSASFLNPFIVRLFCFLLLYNKEVFLLIHGFFKCFLKFDTNR